MGNEKLQWHPAFCTAIEIELENEEGIEFHREYNLTRKPLQIDIVIMDRKKKGKDRKVKGIAGILHRYNIIEYKSPDDTMSIDDFYKVNAYAGLFKSETSYKDEIKAKDIAIILVSSQRPRKLLKYVRDYCKMTVEELEKGIYKCVGGGLFTTYIVVAHPRFGGDHPWLNSLSKNLEDRDSQEIGRLLEEAGERQDARRDAVLELVLKANPELAKKMKEDDEMRAIQILFEPELAEAKELGEKRGEDRKLVSQVCRKLRRRKDPEVIAEELEEDLNVIQDICRAAAGLAPEYDEEKVFSEFARLNTIG